MAESEADQESTQEDKSGEGKKKKQIIIAVVAVGIIVLAVVITFFVFSGADKKGVESNPALLLPPPPTGHGELIVENIPDLEPISYPALSGDQEKEEGQSTEQGNKGNKVERLPNGEVIYTLGNPSQLGEKTTVPGIVVVDQMVIQNGESNEKRVQARIQNQGGRFLASVQLTCHFLDRNGQSVLAREVNPLVISGGLFGDKVQTLAPGAERLFHVDATHVPGEWSGSVRVDVQYYHFAP